MDAAAHWPDQEIGLLKFASCSSSSMEELRTMVVSSSSSSIKPSTMTRTAPQVIERRMRPSKERPLHCPRCRSTNTKFCYYNNYSLTQPRYFCKTCRRYWTEGGALRNVPVGGGSRKSKKPTTTTSSSAAAAVAVVATGEPTPLPLSSSAYEKRLIGLTPQEHNTNFQEVKDFNLLHFYSNNSVQNWLLSGPLQETASGAEVYPSGGGLGPPGFLSSGTVGFPMDASMGEGGGRSILPFQHLLQNRGRDTNTSSGLWNGVMGDGISR